MRNMNLIIYLSTLFINSNKRGTCPFFLNHPNFCNSSDAVVASGFPVKEGLEMPGWLFDLEVQLSGAKGSAF